MPTGTKQASIATNPAIGAAVEKGAKWLAAVQGADGGWGQDGGDSSNARKDVPLETSGNDVANTALAALALLRAGNQYRPNVERAVDFILKRVESSPGEGLAITPDGKQTQVQRKLGPCIDTFVAAMLLAQVDGTFAKAANERIRAGLQKCVSKIEKNQAKDGSWNTGGGWAPLLGTSIASRSLFEAGKKGVPVNRDVILRAEAYTVKNQNDRDLLASAGGSGSGRGSGAGPGSGSGTGPSSAVAMGGTFTAGTPSTGSRGAPPSVSATGGVSGVADGPASAEFGRRAAALPSAAGVELYQDAQALEQLSRTKESREKNAAQIASINSKLGDSKFVEGYGSIGGEEFFSYLNIGDGLKRSGGKGWADWYAKISQKILKLQNSDGTWAGHHCITGRVAVTSAAILNLALDRVD
jgi:hypothetical protein